MRELHIGRLSIQMQGPIDIFSGVVLGFLAYVENTRVEGTTTLIEVSVIWEIPNVFLEDFPGVPFKRQVKF